MAHRSPGEQQAGDVRARDQQQHHHGREEHQQPRLDLRADEVIDERSHADPAVLVEDGMRTLERGGNLIHLRLGLRQRHIRLQARDDLEIGHHPFRIAHAICFGDDIRNPDVGRPGRADRIGEVRRHDTDHFVAGFVRTPAAFEQLEGNDAADDVRIGAEAAAPQGIAEQGHAIGARDLVVDRERPPQRGGDAKHLEEVGSDALRDQRFRLGSRQPQRQPAAGDGGHRFEYLLLRGPVAIVLGRDEHQERRVATERARRRRHRWALAHGHQAMLLVEWQAAEHHRVDDREDRRGRADAEREHDQRRDGESPVRPKRSNRAPEIVAHALPPPPASIPGVGGYAAGRDRVVPLALVSAPVSRLTQRGRRRYIRPSSARASAYSTKRLLP